MKQHQITLDQYLDLFKRKRKRAHRQALDIRKFEIDLYWRRASYFWTFIAADLAALAVTLSEAKPEVKTDLSVLLSCLGVVFSVGWFVANRGSKFWQENWENHVDLLEDDESGPLYKMILSRPSVKIPALKDLRKSEGRALLYEWLDSVLVGPSKHSVSKVNQLISAYVALLWMGLLIYCVPKNPENGINWYYTGAISMTALTCLGFFTLGRTYTGEYHHVAMLRTTIISVPDQAQSEVQPDVSAASDVGPESGVVPGQ